MKSVAYIITLLGVTACATQVTPAPTGGSKADGIVTLSYELGEFQQAIIDSNRAMQNALKRCQAWGYSSAEKFEGQKRQCLQYGGFGGCARYLISEDYQCTDNLRSVEKEVTPIN
jgi:putative integron gene cassette protein